MSAETPAVREALPVYEIEAPKTERVPEGYRQTEVGVIPEDWVIVPLSELLEFRNGVNADKDAYGQGTPFVNVLEVITHAHLRSGNIPGRITLPSVLVASYAVRQGDVLFNRTSETQEEVGLASVYLENETVVFGGFVIRGRVRGNALDEIYSGYALRSPIIRSQIVSKGQGAVRANIGQQELYKVAAVLPPLHEQRAIAAALSDVDALIAALDKLIVKKRAVKTAAMQQLLTGERRLPGFSGEWEARRLGDLAEIHSGGTPSSNVPSYYNGRIPWVSISDMTKRGKYVVATDRNLTEKGLASSTARIFPRGTILYAMYASIGECSIASVDLCSSQAILGIGPTRSLDHNFLYFALVSKKQTVQRMGQQGTQANLNAGIVKNFLVPVPPLEEQAAIATVLTDIDAEIAALEARREKTRQVKQGMMQELLTGRTRLV